ncbi:MAG TPA: cation:proton antiporter [Streptosporangiaceae bacterium]
MTAHQVEMLLFDLAAILLAARLMGAAARRLGQPSVIGEIVAGIVLGPTVLGTTAARFVFPLEVRPALTAVADIGLAIFMFIVGLELDRSSIRQSLKGALSVSLGSTVVPFVMGAALAYALIRHNSSHHLLAFVVFVGAAMSITSFPVLARILIDLTMHRIPLGVQALTGAAANNVIAWVGLAVALVMAGSGTRSLWLIALVPAYLALMLGVIRPLLRRLVAKRPADTGGLLPVILVGLLASGVATEWLGLNFIFGAFLFGVIMPADADGAGQLRHDIQERLGRLCMLLLLPVFFVVAGLQVNLDHIGLSGIGELALILVVAITSKYVGAFSAARLLGTDIRQSTTLATLMNTRGLTELIVLSIGLQLSIIDQDLYSYMVMMTVVTTAMVGPLMRFIYPRRFIERDLADVIMVMEDDEPVLTASATQE